MATYSISDFAFGLSSPIRYEILKLIKENGTISNKEISERLKMHPSNISQHLKVLKQMDLVKEEERLKDNTILLTTVPKTIRKLQEGLSFLFT